MIIRNFPPVFAAALVNGAYLDTVLGGSGRAATTPPPSVRRSPGEGGSELRGHTESWRRLATCCIADWQSAKRGMFQARSRFAECHSAIQQTNCLRYRVTTHSLLVFLSCHRCRFLSRPPARRILHSRDKFPQRIYVPAVFCRLFTKL